MHWALGTVEFSKALGQYQYRLSSNFLEPPRDTATVQACSSSSFGICISGVLGRDGRWISGCHLELEASTSNTGYISLILMLLTWQFLFYGSLVATSHFMWMGLGHKFINKSHKQISQYKYGDNIDFLAKTACHICVPFSARKGTKEAGNGEMPHSCWQQQWVQVPFLVSRCKQELRSWDIKQGGNRGGRWHAIWTASCPVGILPHSSVWLEPLVTVASAG